MVRLDTLKIIFLLKLICSEELLQNKFKLNKIKQIIFLKLKLIKLLEEEENQEAIDNNVEIDNIEEIDKIGVIDNREAIDNKEVIGNKEEIDNLEEIKNLEEIDNKTKEKDKENIKKVKEDLSAINLKDNLENQSKVKNQDKELLGRK